MSRYENTRITRDKNKGVLKYDTTIYKKVPEHNNDIYVITTAGDRLDTLATQFYNDASLWWFIGHVNSISTMNLEPGTKLRISYDVEKASGLLDTSNRR